MSETKKCSVCNTIKPLTDFHVWSMSKDGHRAQCKTCRKKHSAKEYAQLDLETKQRYLAQQNIWKETIHFVGAYRSYTNAVNAQLKSLYNITAQEHNALLIKQDNNCAICGDKLTASHLDHCHKTNAIRGLLCPHCNQGLGHFRDSIERLNNAALYLAPKD